MPMPDEQLPPSEPSLPELAQLSTLKAQAPAATFDRFRRRASFVQGTRMLFETQVTGFWVVLDTILKRLLGGEPPEQSATANASVRSTGENA